MTTGRIRHSHLYEYQCLKGYFLQDEGDDDDRGGGGGGGRFDCVSILH